MLDWKTFCMFSFFFGLYTQCNMSYKTFFFFNSPVKMFLFKAHYSVKPKSCCCLVQYTGICGWVCCGAHITSTSAVMGQDHSNILLSQFHLL